MRPELTSGAISMRVSFLRSVALLMTRTDLDVFEEVCKRLLEGTPTTDDMRKLEELENKFLQGG